MAEPAIVTRGLTKVFPPPRRGLLDVIRRRPRRPAVHALGGVDLDVQRGELFGLLGPNGAGKTTLVKILSTLLLPTEGEASVGGRDVRTEAGAIRREVGVVLGGDRALYWRLTARENLRYFAALFDMPKDRAREASERVLAEVGLTDRADDRVENYSKGMRQRLHIARGLLTDPAILLLDEPTIGLDPHAARSLRALVRKLVDEHGRTVVLTTHYLYEADELSDRVGVLHKGRLIALSTPEALKAAHAGGGAVLVRVREPPAELEKRLAADPAAAAVTSSRVPDDAGVVRFRVTLARADEAAASRLAQLVAASGARLLGIDAESPTLEDVFVKLTGEGLAGEDAGGEEP